MMKGTFVDDNMSNLTSASNEANLSSSNRNQIGTMYPQQSFASVSNDQTQPPTKKKRNLPGNPDPEAEVIALSPRALLATNRFICEVCNKGFQRDQNLQLHRRGHNLPWKLKQRANKELIRKKVYVCPEPSCVHHDPSRALGDLTGIKKHFSRKHGEKKWKCEKCSKRYAVQSDWKAHSKICGTREYRCDCGTLFSRRDSFITHRAFCDALAEETARSTTMSILPQNPQASSNLFNFQQNLSTHVLKSEQDFNPRPDIPPWLDQTIMHPNPNPNLTPAHMSATALLQKAAQMGATMSKGGRPHEAQFGAHQAHHMCTTTGSGNAGLSLHGEMGTGFGANVTSGCMDQVGATVDTMMGSLSSASGFEGSTFEEAYNGMLSSRVERKFKENLPQGGGNDGLTRDFLGLRGFPHRDFVNMGGFGDISTSPSSYHQRNNQNQAPWQG